MTVRFCYVTLFYYNQNTLPHSFLTQLAFKQAETSKQCLVCKIQPVSLLRRYKHSTRIFFSFLVEALKLQQSPCQEAQPHSPNIPVCARASCERTSRWMRPGLWRAPLTFEENPQTSASLQYSTQRTRSCLYDVSIRNPEWHCRTRLDSNSAGTRRFENPICVVREMNPGMCVSCRRI